MQTVNPLEHPDWDAALMRRPDFSFFHGLAWTRTLAEAYGFKPMWLTEGEAWLPLMEVDSWLTGRRGVGLPFTDDSGPLCESTTQGEALFQQARELGRARGWKSIEVRGGRQFLGTAPASVAFYGHQIDLKGDSKELFGRLDGSARQAIRKAEKSGVTVTLSRSEQAMRDFYFLQCLTRKRHGLPPQPWPFFRQIWRQVMGQNQGAVALAAWQGRIVAGAVYFFLGGRAIYKFGASDYRQQQVRPNNLVMWEAMKWLQQQGITSLHLGKTSLLHDGLRRFKLQLGAVEHAMEYVKFDLRKDQFVVEADGVAGWHNAVFRALPMPLARGAGKLLYKHWA